MNSYALQQNDQMLDICPTFSLSPKKKQLQSPKNPKKTQRFLIDAVFILPILIFKSGVHISINATCLL